MRLTGKLFELDNQFNRIILEVTEEQMQKLETYLERTLLPEFQGYSPLVPQYNLVKITKAYDLPDIDPELPITVTINPKPYNFVNWEAEIIIKGLSFQYIGLSQPANN